jgi:O-antigen/teichoic acid export membrane protein
MVRNTGSLLIGQVGRVILQGTYFVLIARALGVDAFGAFSGTVALVALISPFGSLGAINLMISRVSRHPDTAAAQFATALKVTAIAGFAMVVLVTGTAQWLAPKSVSVTVVLCIAFAELLGGRLVDVAGSVFAARQEMAQAAALPVWLNGARLIGAAVLLIGPWEFTLNVWSVVYLAASASATVLAILITRRRFGQGRSDLGQFRREWREGILFSISLASQSVYNDIDKAMLARLSTLEATGIYTAAYRVVEMAFTPMRAMLSAAYPRFFQHGTEGILSTSEFARRLARPGVAYCSFAAVALFVGADLVPWILGSSYESAVGALRGLAVLPVLKAIHYLAADTLTGAGYQGYRSLIQIGVAAANVALNFVLIPAYSWRGAVVASLLSDGALALALFVVVVLKSRGERRGSPIRGGVIATPSEGGASEQT